MTNLSRRIRALVSRIQSGEGGHVAADVGEVLELWLTSGLLPLPRGLVDRAAMLGRVIGDLARAARPAPTDVPPPIEVAPRPTGVASKSRKVVEVTAPSEPPKAAEPSPPTSSSREPAVEPSELAEAAPSSVIDAAPDAEPRRPSVRRPAAKRGGEKGSSKPAASAAAPAKKAPPTKKSAKPAAQKKKKSAKSSPPKREQASSKRPAARRGKPDE